MSHTADAARNAPALALRGLPLRQGQTGWVLSLAFWACLLFATLLYAAVALSPKLLSYLELRQEQQKYHMQLVGVERQIQHLDRIVDALQHDAGFAKELLRIDFDASHHDEERIPVESNLKLPLKTGAAELDVAQPDLPWFAPLLHLLAYNTLVGNTLLFVAASMVIYAFACLHDRPLTRR